MATKRTRSIPQHGTRSRYQHRDEPCRCSLCKAANAREKRRMWLANRYNPNQLRLR